MSDDLEKSGQTGPEGMWNDRISCLSRKKHIVTPETPPEVQDGRVLISGRLAVRIHNALESLNSKHGLKQKLPKPTRIDDPNFFDSLVERITEGVKSAKEEDTEVKVIDVRADETSLFRNVFRGKEGVWGPIASHDDLLPELLRRINCKIDTIIYSRKVFEPAQKDDKKNEKEKRAENDFTMINKADIRPFFEKRYFSPNRPANLSIRDDSRFHKVFLATFQKEIAPLLQAHLKMSQADFNAKMAAFELEFDKWGTITFQNLITKLPLFFK